MPIVFSMPNRNILLSNHKVAQVLNANNEREATRITNLAEFVSGIIDWFRGGTHKKEIIALFHTLQESQHGATEMPDRCRLDKFDQLRQLALPEYRNQFQLEVVCPAARFGWGYTLKVNDQILYQCENVLEKSNNRDVDQLSFFHAANIRMKMEDMVYQKLGIEADGEMDYLSFYKNASLSRLFNISPKDVDPLMIKLQAREYRLENLEKIENYQYGISFDAVFKQGNRITISDANVSAMRALNETLQDKLLSGRYKEWDTLLAEGYKTKDDNVLRALTAPLKRNYCDMINREEMLAESGWDNSHNALREITIADIPLFELWDLANEVGGYEDDVLESNPAHHLITRQDNWDGRRDVDGDSLNWPDDSDDLDWLGDSHSLDWPGDNYGLAVSYASIVSALPPLPPMPPLPPHLSLTPQPMPSPLAAIASLPPTADTEV